MCDLKNHTISFTFMCIVYTRPRFTKRFTVYRITTLKELINQ